MIVMGKQKKKKEEIPPCSACGGELDNLKHNVCSWCEKNHGPFRFKRMDGSDR